MILGMGIGEKRLRSVVPAQQKTPGAKLNPRPK